VHCVPDVQRVLDVLHRAVARQTAEHFHHLRLCLLHRILTAATQSSKPFSAKASGQSPPRVTYGEDDDLLWLNGMHDAVIADNQLTKNRLLPLRHHPTGERVFFETVNRRGNVMQYLKRVGS
jgi:hypothetical protein